MTIIWHILFRWNIYDADAGAFFGSALRTLGHFEPVLKTFFCVPSLLTGLRQPAFSWHPAHWKVDVQRQSRQFFLCTEPNHAKTKTMEQLSCSNLVKQMYKYYVVPMFWFQSSCIAVRCAGALACKNQFSYWILVHKFKFLNVAKPERLYIYYIIYNI